MIVVTGAAGFIGSHLAHRLLDAGESVLGIDDFNAYYPVALKRARAERLEARPGFRMVELDLADHEALKQLVATSGADCLVHLAAQAGVRYSIDHPWAYERANLAGHLSVLEACRATPAVKHLIYASSSSVYGERTLDRPFSEDDRVDGPVSLYAATKRSAELMSHTYSHLYGLAQTGLRFFTVYGPWGRPDMAYFGFTKKMLAGEPIEIFGQGRMARDFTYIDDIVDGILGVMQHPASPGEARLFNIGDNRPVPLMRMIEVLEQALGREAEKIYLPMQQGDVPVTCADISRLNRLCGYQPKVKVEEGLPRFVEWYRDYHGY